MHYSFNCDSINGKLHIHCIQWAFVCIWQVGPVYPKSPIGSVSFQAETDNRKNFPDDRTFHLFKRQRYFICKTKTILVFKTNVNGWLDFLISK